MYIPEIYLEQRSEVLLDLIRSRSFGTLITLGRTGIDVTHLPFAVQRIQDEDFLVGHVARANSQWSNYSVGTQAVASFIAENAYISPSWYPTKKETGRVVPTWSYVAVEARGPLTIIESPVELLEILNVLTDRHESTMPEPWSTQDAPEDFTSAMLRAIVGFRMKIQDLQGSWKLNQKKNEADRRGTIAGLRSLDPKATLPNLMEASLETD